MLAIGFSVSDFSRAPDHLAQCPARLYVKSHRHKMVTELHAMPAPAHQALPSRVPKACRFLFSSRPGPSLYHQCPCT